MNAYKSDIFLVREQQNQNVYPNVQTRENYKLQTYNRYQSTKHHKSAKNYKSTNNCKSAKNYKSTKNHNSTETILTEHNPAKKLKFPQLVVKKPWNSFL